MRELIEPGWEQVRHIIRDWLASHGLSQRKLAAKVGVTVSVISRFLNRTSQTLDIDTAAKLFVELGSDMTDIDRRTFLKITGLQILATAVRRNPFFAIDKVDLDLTSAPPEQRGTHLMNEANRVAQHSWEEAIPVYSAAEDAFKGTSIEATSGQAAFAGTMIAQMLVNLCDYDKARQEVDRVWRQYKRVIDPKTDAELHRIIGWLNYYQGNYPQAVSSFGSCWQIAQEYGDEYLGESAQHFSGRVYRDWGELSQTLGRKEEAEQLFNLSLTSFNEALRIHKKYGNDTQAAFDLLRKAQLFRVQGKYPDNARQLRIEAQGMFGRNRAFIHISQEEASLALEDGYIDVASRKAREILELWTDVRYPKGISDSLYILGEIERVDLRPDTALAAYIAALCIYPFENNLRNRHLWGEILPDICSDLSKDHRRKESYSDLVRELQASADKQQGYFTYLNHAYGDHNPYIERVFAKLRDLRPQT